MPPHVQLLWALLALSWTTTVATMEFAANQAVLVSASRFWFNYRHTANTLAVYQHCRRLGIRDQDIVLMLADDTACNPRNAAPCQVYAHPAHDRNLLDATTQIDFKGPDVTVQNFMKTLTVQIYLTGHGGEDFLKFNDKEELTSSELAEALGGMYRSRTYANVLLIIDTCQAATLFSQIRVPNVLAVASSVHGESSYSHFLDRALGLPVVDRFTHYLQDAVGRLEPASNVTISMLLEELRDAPTESTMSHKALGSPATRIELLPATSFFGQLSRL